MKFDKLPPRVQKHIYDLASDDEFQKVFAQDQELDRIQEAMKRKQDRYKVLCAMQSGYFPISGRLWRAPSPQALVFLAAVQSPLVPGGPDREPTEADVDLWLWATQQPDPDFSGDWAAASIGYTRRFGDFQPMDIAQVTRLSLDPFRMLPQIGGQDSEFDPVWMASVTSRAAQAAGQTAREMARGPLVRCAAYFVEWVKANSEKQLHDRGDQDLMRAYDCRACQIICDQLQKRGKITAQEAARYFDMMTLHKETEK